MYIYRLYIHYMEHLFKDLGASLYKIQYRINVYCGGGGCTYKPVELFLCPSVPSLRNLQYRPVYIHIQYSTLRRLCYPGIHYGIHMYSVA
jgi:hypothetical protein